MTAQSIRDFLRTLFTGRYVRSLEEHIAELKQERDYFRGRSERLELMLLPNRRSMPTASAQPANDNLTSEQWLSRVPRGTRFADIEKGWIEREFAPQAEQKKENGDADMGRN